MKRILRAQPGQSLTLEEMRQSLPSIFAEDAHDSRSARYVYISTKDMLARMMEGGFLPVEARTVLPKDYSRTGFAKHMLRFRGADDLAKPENDTMFGKDAAYEVILRNAHDGTSSYQMLAGLIRYACENGLVISDGTVESIRVQHTGMNRRLMADRVLAAAQHILDQGPAVGKRISRWKTLVMGEDERASFARAAHKLRFGKPDGQVSIIKPEQLIVPRRPADTGKSLWDVFNVVQENAVRGGLEGRTTTTRRKITTREISSIDDDLRLNRSLWNLAERAARIKVAGKPATNLEFADERR
jgi:Domain of unknown function (DUF932)